MKQLLGNILVVFQNRTLHLRGGYAKDPADPTRGDRPPQVDPRFGISDLLTLAHRSPALLRSTRPSSSDTNARGLRGACASLLGAVLPSFLIILAIALFFAGIRQNPVVDAAFKGMRPAVVALIIAPLVTLTRACTGA